MGKKCPFGLGYNMYDCWSSIIYALKRNGEVRVGNKCMSCFPIPTFIYKDGKKYRTKTIREGFSYKITLVPIIDG